MKVFLFLFLIVTTNRLASQQLIRAGGGLPQLTGYSPEHNGIFSFTKNPALLGRLRKNGVGFYAERKYLLDELNYYSLVTAVNHETGGYGIEINYMGSPMYHQANLGFAYGRKLSDVINIGMELKYDNISIPNYGKAGIITVAGGGCWQLGKGICSGIYFQRAVKSKFGIDKEEQWPGLYSLAFGYDVSPRFFMGLEFEKTEDRPVNVNSWMQYHVAEQVSVSIGLASANTMIVAGVTYLLRSFELAIMSAYDQQLGISPSLRTVFYFKQKMK